MVKNPSQPEKFDLYQYFGSMKLKSAEKRLLIRLLKRSFSWMMFTKISSFYTWDYLVICVGYAFSQIFDIKGLIKQLKNPFQPMWHSSGLSSREWESKSRQDNTKNEIAFHFGYKDKSEIFCSIVLHSCVFAYRKEEKKVKRRSYYVCKSPVQKCKYWNWVLVIVLTIAVIKLEGEMHQFQKQFSVVKKLNLKAFK